MNECTNFSTGLGWHPIYCPTPLLLYEIGGPWPTHYWPCCNFVCHYNCT